MWLLLCIGLVSQSLKIPIEHLLEREFGRYLSVLLGWDAIDRIECIERDSQMIGDGVFTTSRLCTKCAAEMIR